MLSVPVLTHSYLNTKLTDSKTCKCFCVHTLSPLSSPLSFRFSRLTRKEELPSKHASERTTHLKYKSSLWGMHQYKQWWHRERTALVKCLWALSTMVCTNLCVCYIGGKCTCANGDDCGGMYCDPLLFRPFAYLTSCISVLHMCNLLLM